MSNDATEAGVVGTKQCPFCAETIKAEAIKCKHCGSDLKKTSNNTPSKSAPTRDISTLLKSFLQIPKLTIEYYKAHKKGLIIFHTAIITVGLLYTIYGGIIYPKLNYEKDKNKVIAAGYYSLVVAGMSPVDTTYRKLLDEFVVGAVNNPQNLSEFQFYRHLPKTSELKGCFWFLVNSRRFHSPHISAIRNYIREMDLGVYKCAVSDEIVKEIDKARINWKKGYDKSAFKRAYNGSDKIQANIIKCYSQKMNSNIVSLRDDFKKTFGDGGELLQNWGQIFLEDCAPPWWSYNFLPSKMCFSIKDWFEPRLTYEEREKLFEPSDSMISSSITFCANFSFRLALILFILLSAGIFISRIFVVITIILKKTKK